MAQPTFVAASTLGGDTTSPYSITIAVPGSYQDDDIIIASCLAGDLGSATFTPPSGDGWTSIAGQINQTYAQIEWFWKRANGSESDKTFTSDKDNFFLQLSVWRGCETSGDPFENEATDGPVNRTTVPTSNITPTTAESLVVCFANVEDNAGWSTSPPPTGWTTRSDETSSVGSDGRATIITYNDTDPTTGVQIDSVNVGTFPGNDVSGTLTLCLIPPAAANVEALPGTGVMTFTGYLPEVTSGDNIEVLPGTGAITFTGYAPTVYPILERRILIDCGDDGTGSGDPVSNPDTNGNYWNNATSNSTNQNASGPYEWSNLVDTDNGATTVDFEIVTPIDTDYGTQSGMNDAGDASGVSDYVANATIDSFFSYGGTAGEYRIKGLDSSKTYTIKFWGARNATDARSIEIKLNADSWPGQNYNANNASRDYDNAAVFEVSGATSYDFDIRTYTTDGSTFGYIGVIDIKEYTAEPAGDEEVLPGAGVITYTGYAPTVSTGVNQEVQPGTGVITYAGYAPNIHAGLVEVNGATGSPYDYLKYVPINYIPANDYPLIVFFHGLGENGTDLNDLYAVGLPPAIRDGNVTPEAIIVCPQLGSGYWDDQLTDMVTFMEHCTNEGQFGHKVDANSIHVTGLSSGGGGVITLVGNSATWRRKIASAAPLSPSVDIIESTMTNCGEVALWGFHGANDTFSNAHHEKTEALSYYAKRADIKPYGASKITLFTGYAHVDAVWQGVYDGTRIGATVEDGSYLSETQTSSEYDENIIDWMLSHTLATIVDTDTGAITLTGFAPTVTASDHQEVLPDVGSITYSGFSPTIELPVNNSGFSPTIELPVNIQPDVGAVVFTGFEPTVSAGANVEVLPDVGAVTFAGFAPTVSTTANIDVQPDVGTIAFAGFAPAISYSDDVEVTPDVGTLNLTGFEPTVLSTAHIEVNPDTGTVSLVGFSPDVSASDNKEVQPDTGVIVLTGYEPTLGIDANVRVYPDTGALALTGLEPSIDITQDVLLSPQTGEALFTGYVPAVSITGPELIDIKRLIAIFDKEERYTAPFTKQERWHT